MSFGGAFLLPQDRRADRQQKFAARLTKKSCIKFPAALFYFIFI